jgi:spore coat protein U-like protein
LIITPASIPRYLIPATSQLAYNVYREAGHLTVWGDSTGGTYDGTIDVTTAIGGGNYQGTATVYALLPHGQVSAAGTYSQTLRARVYYAATSRSRTFNVTVTTTAGCAISAGGTMNFGSLGVPFINTDKTGVSANISYACTAGRPATITLGRGANPAGGSTDAAPLRRMRHGASDYISYNLYKDLACSQLWGNTTGTGWATTGTGLAQNVAVYGKATHANVLVGSYNDTVVVTITF